MKINKELYPPGSQVWVADKKIKAHVMGLCVRDSKMETVEYHIAYFRNGERKSEWVYEWEINGPVKDNSEEVGFHKPGNQKLIT